ncbi:DUF3310 domain-containing protein [Virgibacillus salexigens]|uniref:DUF3310 domain-containing protein n=1 Tax=Virgibacillus massiliensis TaxID=1462526 RepID=A0A024QBG4_9BACI|nr:DUF3310 domain-containing protein [Virgibacillus massiliensis]CDQ39520.1 hypothetical protein BN990_01825 [Virgibacillus massiliensis]
MIPKYFEFEMNGTLGKKRYTAIQTHGGFEVYGNSTGNFIKHYGDATVARKLGEKEWLMIHKEESDNVNHPDHYQGKTEVIDIIEQATEGLQGINAVCTGNVIKYVMRFQKKGGVEDLKKAQWYLNKLIGGYENE